MVRATSARPRASRRNKPLNHEQSAPNPPTNPKLKPSAEAPRQQRKPRPPAKSNLVANKENRKDSQDLESPLAKETGDGGEAKTLTIDAKEFLSSCGKINRILNKVHEHVSPKYTSEERAKFGMESEYGGITGTLRPSAISRVAQVLSGKPDPSSKQGILLPQEMWFSQDSVFLDIGSGTGRPVIYMASTPIRASVGFDIDPMQTWNSCNGLSLVEKGNKNPLKCPVAFFQADVLRIQNLDPVTHAYAFLGYPDIINATALLLARSRSVKVFVAVVLHEKEIKSTGLVDDRSDVIVLTGLQMPGGNSYMAYVIPMTKKRRAVILKRLSATEEVDRLISDFEGLSTTEAPQLDISTTFTRSLNLAIREPQSGKEQLETLRQFPYFDQDQGPRKSTRRAALLAKKKFQA